MKTIDYEKKEMIPLTKEENKRNAIYVKKRFEWIKMMKIILIEKKLKTAVITP